MTVIIEINNEQDLSALEEFLTGKGLKFEVKDDNDDWGDLSNAEIDAIKAGIDDFKNGRVVSHSEAMTQIDDHIRNRKVRA
jgi:hypothetical protein